MNLSIYPSIYLFIHLSVYHSVQLSTHPSMNLSIYPSIYLFIHLSVYHSVQLSIYRSIYLSIYPSLYLSIFLSVHPSIYLSIYLSIDLSIYLSISLSIYPSSCLFIHLSIHRPIASSVYLFFHAKKRRLQKRPRHYFPSATDGCTIPARTLVHAAESEARPEKTHASFKVVLPNLRQGCALWRKIAMQKADAAPMGQKKHHRRLHDGSEKKNASFQRHLW